MQKDGGRDARETERHEDIDRVIIQRVIIYFLLSTNLLDNLIFIRRHASLAFNEDFDFQNYTFYPNKVILS